MDRLVAHRALYKSPRTPPWKETYRKRCMDRLRANRSKLVHSLRRVGDAMNNNTGDDLEPEAKKARLVQDIMEIEWNVMNKSHAFPSLRLVPGDLGEDGVDPSEEYLATMDEIERELMEEDERLLNEVLSYDAASLASQVSAMLRDEVICPVCQVRSNVECTVEEHSHTCQGVMVFTRTTDTQGTNVLITCPSCEWMSFLL
ncbi:RPA-interacting protein B-like isoform X2 [Oratosquilla oratoria]|uniref:RPA-interacting protein B-like isoform X2 n=1 Tax=Oratosquilla oratoria TaxID=337810 RepID=UPI003F766A91